jgi:hypothetical protein
MKAINPPFYKTKLRDISRELYYEDGWKMSQGLLDGNNWDPLNYSLSEWQHAKRQGEDSKALQKMFQNCWAVSDNRPSFEQALQRYGLYLAKGTRKSNGSGAAAAAVSGEAWSSDFHPKGCLDGWVEGAKTRILMSRTWPIHCVRQGSLPEAKTPKEAWRSEAE